MKKLIKLISVAILIGGLQIIPICASGDSTIAIIPIEIEGATDTTVVATSDDKLAMSAVKDTVIKCDTEGTKEVVVTADEPEEYEYTLKQTFGTKENVKYDQSEYKAKVFFETMDDGNLESHVVVWKTGETTKSDSVKYYNLSDSKESSNSATEGTNLYPSICALVCGCLLIFYAHKKHKNRVK